MLIEQRMTWIEQIPFRWRNDVHIISFGSESCVIPFLDIDNHWETFLSLLKLKKRIKIITPRISQKEKSSVVDLLMKIVALHKPIDFVVNDLGLLELCTKNKAYLNIHIGRQLCRSLLDCPWNQEILNNESNEVCEILTSHPFSNQEIIKELSICGVKGVELNALSKDFNLQPIIENNLEIAVHCENYLLSCGRICLGKRIIPNKDCKNICEEIFQLEPTGKWLGYLNNREPFNNYEKRMLNGLAISGKKVTLPQKLDIRDIILCKVDVLVATQPSVINNLKGMM